MTTDAEWAWAAGLFEGEGCIYVGRGRTLCLAMTDRDVVERFAAVVGCGTVRPRSRRNFAAHHKDAWEWRVSRWADRERVLRGMLPWLGERRRAKAEEMLGLPLTHGVNEGTCRAGAHPWTPDNIYVTPDGRRCCRKCRQASSAAHKRRVKERNAA